MNYKELFDDKAKAAAFDKIAENYYECNFGTMPKSELDLLMFSIYADRILAANKNDSQDYSDYELSKALGITQQRISSLKVKKQLKYPRMGFDWKDEFSKISKNARYEDGKIKVYIPDPNIYIELKNVIEKAGGFVEVTLNPKLLQISPEYYLWLVKEISSDEDKSALQKIIDEKLEEEEVNIKKIGQSKRFEKIKELGSGFVKTVFTVAMEKVGDKCVRTLMNKFCEMF